MGEAEIEDELLFTKAVCLGCSSTNLNRFWPSDSQGSPKRLHRGHGGVVAEHYWLSTNVLGGGTTTRTFFFCVRHCSQPR